MKKIKKTAPKTAFCCTLGVCTVVRSSHVLLFIIITTIFIIIVVQRDRNDECDRRTNAAAGFATHATAAAQSPHARTGRTRRAARHSLILVQQCTLTGSRRGRRRSRRSPHRALPGRKRNDRAERFHLHKTVYAYKTKRHRRVYRK